jgi:O-antigen/teichoic acid export membrane protein
MQEFGAFNLVALVSQLGAFVLSIVMVWILRMDVIGAVLAITAGQVSAVLAAMYAVRRGHAKAHTMNFGAYARMVLPYGAAANTKTLIDFGVRHIDVFLVNLFLGPGPAGIYSMASALAERLSIVSSSPSAVMLPRISELEGSDDIREQVTPVMARHVLWAMLLIGIVVFGLASLFVTVIYGPSFAGAANAFRILVLGTIATSLSHVLATDIAGRGKPQVNARISALSLVITVLLDAVLIPRIGIYGAAAGCSIAWTVGALLTVSYYCRLTRVRWTSVVVLRRSDLQRLARVFRTQTGKRLNRGPDPL